MSISAPEAHHTHLPDKVIRGAEDYVDGLADLGSIMPNELPAIEQTTEAAFRVVAAERNNDNGARHRAAEHLRSLRPGEQTRVIQLARTAIVTSMAAELLRHARDRNATPESRRLAIQLASTALGRHYQQRRGPISRHP